MNIKTWIKYTEGYLPSTRHRKLRYKELEEYVDIELKEISINDMKLKYSHMNICEGYEVLYYEYQNKLFTKAIFRGDRDFRGYKNTLEELQWWNRNGSMFFGFKTEDTRDAMIEKAKTYIDKYLLVDGELYITTTKPMYKIVTFGVGNNHAGIGTALSIANYESWYASILVEPNKRNEVEKEALNIAIKRGDTDSIEYIKNCPIIKEYN